MKYTIKFHGENIDAIIEEVIVDSNEAHEKIEKEINWLNNISNR